MSTQLEDAKAALAEAQRKVAVLSTIPEVDAYPAGTVLRWKHSEGSDWSVAQKTSRGGTQVWYLATASDYGLTWKTVGSYLARGVVAFEVAPADWSDGRLASPPPVKTDGLVLTDGIGNTWDRHGNEWVLR